MTEGREREGNEEGRGNGTEGMGGRGEDMGWHRKGRKREREERGYSLTTIPGATTATIFETVKAATNTQKCYCLTGLFYEDTCSTRILSPKVLQTKNHCRLLQ